MGIDRSFRAVETFRMVPDRMWLSDEIEPQDLRVWCCLSFVARDRGQCEPTDKSLAAKLGVCEVTVRRALLRLERAKFIERGMEGRTRVIRLRPEGDGLPIGAYVLKLA